MPLQISPLGSVPAVSWVNAGVQYVRVFQKAADAKRWANELRGMDHISQVAAVDALVDAGEGK